MIKIEGKIIAVLPPRTGTGKNGPWVAQDYVIEWEEQGYLKRLVFELFGQEQIVQAGIEVGQDLDVWVDMNARQAGDKWFNQVRAWKVVLRNHKSEPPQD